MKARKLLFERYIIKAILPYFGLSWLILTVVLLAQQLGKFSEIVGAVAAPLPLVYEVALGVIPNVSIFTLPMSMLVGTAAAFGRMGGDSEIVSMRAAGVGNLRIFAPVLAFGALLSALTLYNGFELAPRAARSMRQALFGATLRKLESPVEPRAFNTQMPGKVIYIKEGDEGRGLWERVFIHWLEPNGELRLVTARSGRIDLSGEQSELVLSDAAVTTLPRSAERGAERPAGGEARATGQARRETAQVVTEHSDQLRVRLNTGRSELLRQLRDRPEDPEEQDWRALLARAREGRTARSALSTMHRRASLCVTPLSFAFLGVGIGLLVRRGGRGVAVLLSLFSLLPFYFLFLGGDYLERVGALPAYLGAWIAPALSLLFGALLLARGGRSSFRLLRRAARTRARPDRPGAPEQTRPRARRLLLSGLSDRSIAKSQGLYFAASLLLLVGVFLVFTLFELLRFIAVTKVSSGTVVSYLLYLLPLAGLAVTPICVLLSTLLTYSLMTRRNETVVWLACGQSLYRLALPSLFFALTVCGAYWLVQESLLPYANRRQEALRAQIRGGNVSATSDAGSQWLAAQDGRIYVYRFGEGGAAEVRQLTVFVFDDEAVHLRRVIAARKGRVPADGAGLFLEDPTVLELPPGQRGTYHPASSLLLEGPTPPLSFKPALKRPAELNRTELSNYIDLLKLQGAPLSDLSLYTISLLQRYADPLAPLVMALISVPFGIAGGKRTHLIVSMSVGVVIGLAFWGSLTFFNQLGVNSLIPPLLSVSVPPALFTILGIYLFSRSNT
jgi:LPS export ABC transporter permease LptG